jgi:hypothetical protein
MAGRRYTQDASYAAMAAKRPLIMVSRLITATHPAFAAVVAIEIMPLFSIQWGKTTIVSIKVRHGLRKPALCFPDIVLAVLVDNELLGLCV